MFSKSTFKRILIAAIAIVSFVSPLVPVSTTYACDYCYIQKPGH